MLETLVEDLHNKNSIDHYMQYLECFELYVRCSAINGIGKLLGETDISRAITPLTELLINHCDLSSLVASMVLGKIGKPAHDYVMQRTIMIGKRWVNKLAMGSSVEDETESLSFLFTTLGRIASSASVLQLSELLLQLMQYRQDHGADNVRYKTTVQEGLIALGKLQSPLATPFLCKMLNLADDEMDDEMKEVILWGLGETGGDLARNELLKWTRQSNYNLQKKALEAFNKELTIFLSSTFSDMQEDRNVLINDVIPQLREVCSKRGVKLTVMDLRWGLTPEETSRAQTLINACLERIDFCRNHYFVFVSLLGFNYGTVLHWEKTKKDHSVTEIEILHALNHEFASRPNLSLFYLREELSDELEFRNSKLDDSKKKRTT